MKIAIVLALIIGGVSLLGTRHNTPFIRLGIVLAVAGVLVASTTALFAARSLMFGLFVFLAGAAVYYYGRLVRREQLVLPKR